MKKTLLAIAIPAAIFANSVTAIELYKDDVNSFSIGGHVSLGVTGESNDDGETAVDSRSSRLNFAVTREMGNGFTLDAKGEWGINMVEGGENTFDTRLGYAGLTHDTWGRAVIGTQWSPYSSVALAADMPIAFGNDFVYEDHGNLGTARADKMISYTNSFELGNDANIGFGLGWQGTQTDEKTEYDDRAQATLFGTVVGITAGLAYSSGDVKYATGGTEKAKSIVGSLKYGQFGKGLYLAGVYAKNDYMNNSTVKGAVLPLKETYAYEAIADYALDNSLNFMINYETVVDDKENDTVYSQAAFQVEYNFLSNVMGYVGYQQDLGGDGVYDKNDDNNIWTTGVRVFL